MIREMMDLPELLGPKNTLTLLLLIVPCSTGPTFSKLIFDHSMATVNWDQMALITLCRRKGRVFSV